MTRGLVKWRILFVVSIVLIIASLLGVFATVWDHNKYGAVISGILLLSGIALFRHSLISEYRVDFGEVVEKEKRVIDYSNLREGIFFRVIKKIEENHWRIAKASSHPGNYSWCSRIVKGLPDNVARDGCIFFKKENIAYEHKPTHYANSNEADLCESK